MISVACEGTKTCLNSVLLTQQFWPKLWKLLGTLRYRIEIMEWCCGDIDPDEGEQNFTLPKLGVTVAIKMKK